MTIIGREIYIEREIPRKTKQRNGYRHTDNAERPRNKEDIGRGSNIDNIVSAIGNTIEKRGRLDYRMDRRERDIKNVGGTTDMQLVDMHACQCVAKPAISGRKPRFDPNRPHFHINND